MSVQVDEYVRPAPTAKVLHIPEGDPTAEVALEVSRHTGRDVAISSGAYVLLEAGGDRNVHVVATVLPGEILWVEDSRVETISSTHLLETRTSTRSRFGDWRPPGSIGARAIARERERQVEKGYSPEHDAVHGREVLIKAAQAYLISNPAALPWSVALSWSAQTEYERLGKAGALIAAAMDLIAAQQ